MFTWNVAKSAEEMFSRLAMRRVCKFLPKKKLGQFILGEIDLDQLDVQLRAGTIQLTDLVLNVDFLNQKLGQAGRVIIKEGSIGSLLVKMPWNDNRFEVEVDELELLIAPCAEHISRINDEMSTSDQGRNSINRESVKISQESSEDSMAATIDIHEGVKTVARMVKWFLTRFHVTVKRLIVAYDPYSNGDGIKLGTCPKLVLRVSEIECGTSVSEDVKSENGKDARNILGISFLTNFFSFRGAVLELLLVDDGSEQSAPPSAFGAPSVEQFHECRPSSVTSPIITGDEGGFSGTVKLSIPWTDGSLDTRKVDANVAVDPILLRIEPSTIKSVLMLCDSLKHRVKDNLHSTNSVYYNASSQLFSSNFGSTLSHTGKLLSTEESLPIGTKYSMGKETSTSCLLPASLIISDWVPASVNENQTDGKYEELHFGSSVEQFFECFDGLRSSQTALASSGILSWTCSVFNAITAASNLAAGSYYISPEQKHIEANVRATLASISVVFSLSDDDHHVPCKFEEDRTKDAVCRQYLVANVQSLLLNVQVCPQDVKLDVTVEHIELTYFTDWNNNKDSVSDDFNYKAQKESSYMQQLQYAVEDSLPPLAILVQPETKKLSRSSPKTMCARLDTDCTNRLRFSGLEFANKLNVQLLRTFGSSHCQVVLNTDYAEKRSEKPTSFSLRLPPFVFWVNFHVINMLSELLVNMRSEIRPLSGVSSEKNGIIDGDIVKGSHLQVSPSSIGKLMGNIFLIDARIIFCFPHGNNTYPTDCTSWNQFVALDFSSSMLGSELRKEMASVAKKSLSSKTSHSMHLNFVDVDIHLVSCEQNEVTDTQDKQAPKFCSQKILSASSKSRLLSAINMIWQEGSITGPTITGKARTLATSGMGNGNEFKGRGYEFASVNAVKHPRKGEQSSSKARNNFICSSSLILHLHLSSLVVNLNADCYKELHSLLNRVKNIVLISTKEDPAALQTSLLVQCDSLEVLIALDKANNIKKSLQSELPGAWSNLKLNVSKFEFLTVFDLGGIREATFLWVSHSEGKLWGRISETSDLDLLLISCCNSSMKRGDGQGSNTLSSSLAGTDIIHLWEPSSSQKSTSITIKCATIVAAGGRLDWLDAISSFFSLPTETEIDDLSVLQVSKSPKGSSFRLNLVDIGLGYEPYRNLVAAFDDSFYFVSPCSGSIKDEEPYFSCLVAATSLSLLNTQASGAIEDAFQIRIQDLGLLISPVSPPLHVADPYCAIHLHKVGYVKVVGAALLEVIVNTNCKNGRLWEVECFESDINIETCHDTTVGLIRLVGQLQQLVALDVGESVVHLQTRWHNIRHAQESILFGERTHSNNEFSPFQSSGTSNSTKSTADLAGIMDGICENAFHIDENLGEDVSELHFDLSCDGNGSSYRNADHFNQHFLQSMAISESVHGKRLYSQSDISPEFLENYCKPSTQASTEIYPRSHSSKNLTGRKSKSSGNLNVGVHSGWYEGTSLKIVDDHILESQNIDLLKCGEHSFPCLPAQDTIKPKASVLLKNINMRWRMCAGSSWYSSKNDGQSVDIGGKDPAVSLELTLCGIVLQYEIFPDSEVLASKLSLSIQDFHLYDSSKDAPWKLVLGYYHSKDRPRLSSSKALKLNLQAVRPDPATPLEEYRLSAAFLPMLIHLHQSHLEFLTSFFGGLNSSDDSDLNGISGSKLAISKSNNFSGQTITEEALLPFFQKFDIWPVLLRFDYTPRGVDLPALGGGKYAELVNIVPLKGVEIQLKHVHAKGIYGWSSVCDIVVGEWLEDISQNQIHKLLKGLPAIRSLVSVGSGAAKLVSLPLKNYEQDKKLLKGIQRGMIALLRSVSLEAVGLGVHVAAGTHDILIQAEHMLSSTPPSLSQPATIKEKDNIRTNQPKDAQQGIIQACESISSGLGEAASALIGTPLKRYNNGASPGSALASAFRATPVAVIAPAAAGARAVHCTLLGVRNSLDPDHKKESFEKYLGHSSSSGRHK